MKITIAIAVLLLTPAANASFLTTEGSSFFDGLAAGKEGAKTMWQKMGSDCGNIWDFQSDVNSMKGWAFPDSGNWRTRSYNRVACSGVCAIRYNELLANLNASLTFEIMRLASLQVRTRSCRNMGRGASITVQMSAMTWDCPLLLR